MKKITVLNKIVQDKIQWIKINKKKLPLNTFKYKLEKSHRSFYTTLLNNQKKHFIFECKKASPSMGIMRVNFDLNKIIKSYKQYSSIISVLTDEKYFHGSFNFLYQVSNLVTQPILCKDFIIDEWQIYFARLHQADAILLMLSILQDDQYHKLVKVAHALNMGVLTEVINKEEVIRANYLKAKVVGINNRNLHDLTVDINKTYYLAPMLKNTIIISASGIKHHNQIRKLSQYVNGFLIGSTLMLEKNLNIGIRKLLLGENKVCGLNYYIDALAAYDAGAIYGGLIFVKKSPRYIAVKYAYSIIEKARNINFVGVFYNSPIKEIIKIHNFLKLKVIQLHGQENCKYIAKLKSLLSPKCDIWKAYNMCYQKPNYNLANIKRIILDNGGGTGKQFDWSLINKDFLKKIILSGGLSINNCFNAIKIGCAGLDFNSGIESLPGIKDHKKLFNLFKYLGKY